MHNRIARVYLCTALLIHAILLAFGANVHSPTTDEPANLVAGISHWHFSRFDLSRVTPPLVRMVAAVPVLFSHPTTDWTHFYDYPGSSAEGLVALDFCRANGDRIISFVTLARWACIPFSLLGGYICFRWARELYGPLSGILAATLWCFSPNILAHAQLITTDVAGTALNITAWYCFWRWLKHPNWRTTLLTGICFGLVQLTKGTFVILFALFPLLWFMYRYFELRNRATHAEGHTEDAIRKPNIRQQCYQLPMILLLGLYVLNLGYGFEGSFKCLGSYRFVSAPLAGQLYYVRESGNRFTDSVLGSLPVPLPENYLRGLDTQRRYFERKMPSYLHGEWKKGGWWFYYLYGLAIKVPLGTWLLVVLAFVWYCTRRPASINWLDDGVLLLPLAALLFLVSSQTGFNKSLRYVCPIFPFAFIWVSKIAQTITYNNLKVASMAAGALVWSIGSSLCCYPHTLSYFNELVGGAKRGHEHLILSNLDWGQDLLYMKEWLDKHKRDRPLGLAYYGFIDPHVLDIQYLDPPFDARAQFQTYPRPELADLGPHPGLFAISVNFLHGHRWPVFDGNGNRKHLPTGDFYRYFLDLQPVASAGYSIYIYDVSLDEANNARHSLGLPTLGMNTLPTDEVLTPEALDY